METQKPNPDEQKNTPSARHHKGFQRTEQKFFDAIVKRVKVCPGRLTVIAVAKEAKLSKSTFYLHFPSIKEAISRLKKRILEGLPSKIEQVIENMPPQYGRNSNFSVFYSVLVVLMKEKEFYTNFCFGGSNMDLLRNIIRLVYPMLKTKNGEPLPRIESPSANVFIGASAAVLLEWIKYCEQGSHLRIEPYIQQLLYYYQVLRVNTLPGADI